MSTDSLARRQPLRLAPNPARVITQLFVPGHALVGEPEGRATGVVDNVLGLGDEEASDALTAIVERFGGRHRDLLATFRRHAERIANRLPPGTELSDERWLLLGATFTHEVAVEAAALCNPCLVAAPDQGGTPPGGLRFVMSVRQIGEGHRSSIGFRTGLVDGDGRVTVDEPGPFTTAATVRPGTPDSDAFRDLSRRDDSGATSWVLDGLGRRFTIEQLETRLVAFEGQHDTRRNVTETASRLRDLAGRTYEAQFAPSSDLAERVLMPATTTESQGLEDARFVRFVDDDDTVTYYATYTAFDGTAIAQQLVATTDFRTFSSSPLVGPAAANKGLALFPRKIGGEYFALTRHDGATNAVASSNDITRWSKASPLDRRRTSWEVIQVGNCGPPIETDRGWLVLTHGVGPMRTYSVAAVLLDLDHPSTVIGHTRRPLLTPQPDEQNGYVPNVVYCCGALLHADTLLIPFGIGDSNIGFATVAMPDLLAELEASATIPSGDDLGG